MYMFKHHIFDHCFIYVALGTISYRIMTIYIYGFKQSIAKIFEIYSLFKCVYNNLHEEIFCLIAYIYG